MRAEAAKVEPNGRRQRRLPKLERLVMSRLRRDGAVRPRLRKELPKGQNTHLLSSRDTQARRKCLEYEGCTLILRFALPIEVVQEYDTAARALKPLRCHVGSRKPTPGVTRINRPPTHRRSTSRDS